MVTKPKKVGTRRGRDGAQQYTSPKLARDPKMLDKIMDTARNTKVKPKSGMAGRASATAFLQYGAKDLANKVTNVRKTLGKPKGGR